MDVRDKIQNAYIKKDLGVANIKKKINEKYVRWFEHVQSWGNKKIGSSSSGYFKYG